LGGAAVHRCDNLQHFHQRLYSLLKNSSFVSGHRFQKQGDTLPLFSVSPFVLGLQLRNVTPKAFASFFRTMLENGIYLPPSLFEVVFMRTAHT
jgi:glutamate-1-semialdehyde aminotransferase